MARGYDKHLQRKADIGLLGKDLARRAGRTCEWCQGHDDLRPLDTAPDEEPTLEALVLLCPRCSALADGESQDPRTLRFLEGAVWHGEPAVATTACAALARVDAAWARETLEMFSSPAD